MSQTVISQQNISEKPGSHGFLGPDRWWQISFGGLMAIALVVFMVFNIGGNDVANSFGTSVGAGTLSMQQALVIAAIFEISGAVLAGGEVTETVRSGIVDLNAIDLFCRRFCVPACQAVPPCPARRVETS